MERVPFRNSFHKAESLNHSHFIHSVAALLLDLAMAGAKGTAMLQQNLEQASSKKLTQVMGQELQSQCLDMLGIHLKLAFLVMSKDSWRLVTKGKDQHSSTMQHLAIQTVGDILSLREGAQEEVTLYITVLFSQTSVRQESMEWNPYHFHLFETDPNANCTKNCTAQLGPTLQSRVCGSEV